MTEQQGKLIGIARREAKFAPMELLKDAEVTVEYGVARDSRGLNRGDKEPKRQVTLLSAEAWHAVCRALGKELPWTLRRANLLVEGLELKETAGARIRIGALELEVTGEVDPCRRMDEQYSGLTAALVPDWRGGIACRVVAPGRIRLGDGVTLAQGRNSHKESGNKSGISSLQSS